MVAIRRSLPLLFAFSRTNYACWAPIIYEDCMNLEKKFPMIYKSFKKGGFVIYRTRQRSNTPMDQALELVYNKPAKGAGGIIGITRRKEAVALWNITKHEKDCYTFNMRTGTQNDGLEAENTLHHQYTKISAMSSSEDVKLIIEYSKQICNPLSEKLDGKPIRNIVDGQDVKEVFDFVMSSRDKGEALYSNSLDSRLIKKMLTYKHQ